MSAYKRTALDANDAGLHDLAVRAAYAPYHTTLPGAGTSDFFPGTSGPDTFAGTTGDDQFDLSAGGKDTAFGDAGSDEFDMGAALTKIDAIDGGDDYDALVLQGDYSTLLKFTATTAVNIEEIDMFGNFNYNIKTHDATFLPIGTNTAGTGDSCIIFCNAGAGFTVSIDASAESDSALQITTGASDDTIVGTAKGDFIKAGTGTNIIDGGAGEDRVGHFSLAAPLTINLSIAGPQTITTGVTNTYIRIEDVSGSTLEDVLTGNNGNNWLWGNSGDDQLYGGKGADRLEGSADADLLNGGAGDDHYVYGIGEDGIDAAVASTSTAFDTIVGFDFAQDHFELPAAVAAIDDKIKKGALNDATFDSDLETAVKPTKLGAGDAVLFTPTTGDHAGEVFLIIDHNGAAGYQRGADVVIRLDSAAHLTGIDTGDFLAIAE